jgi:hypothetical protein
MDIEDPCDQSRVHMPTRLLPHLVALLLLLLLLLLFPPRIPVQKLGQSMATGFGLVLLPVNNFFL